MTIKIYALKDPLTHKVKYVGKTSAPLNERLRQHVYCAVKGATKRDGWIRELNKAGMLPVIDIIETVTGDWQERERYWIKYYKAMGEELRNDTIGGNGVIRKANS